MIIISGANNIIFDGSFNGKGRYLTLRNNFPATTTASSTLYIYNNATHDTIKNCILEGSAHDGNNGVAAIGKGSIGNSYIRFYNNLFQPNSLGGIFPYVLLSVFPTTPVNSHIDISYNDFRNWSIGKASTYNANALILGNAPYSKIAYNSFFCDSVESLCSQTAIYLNSGLEAINDSIIGNYIGGSQPKCGGKPWENSCKTITGMYLYASQDSVNPCVVSGNIIQNIKATSPTLGNVYGISMSLGAFKIINNTIGSPDKAASIEINSYDDNSNPGTFAGIYQNSSVSYTGPYFISGNTIANVVYKGAYQSSMYGINVYNGVIKGNRIFNIFDYSLSSEIDGIVLTAYSYPASAVDSNYIYNIAATNVSVGSTQSVINGISVNTSSSAKRFSVSKNRISNLAQNLSGNIINGIYVKSSNTSTIWDINNNMISLANSSNGAAIPAGYGSSTTEMYGIRDKSYSGTANYYHNSVLIKGLQSSTNSNSANSYCFYRNTPSSTSKSYVNLKNNIFINARKGKSATAASHNTITNISNDANVTFAANNNFQNYWQSVTDSLNLFYPDSLFTNATYMPGIADLHITSNRIRQYLSQKGAVVGLAYDWDNQKRTLNSPDIGADEFNAAPPPVNFSGVYKIGTTNADFLTITNTLKAINEGNIAGDCFFELQNDYNTTLEKIPINFPEFVNKAAYKITFRPAAGVKAITTSGEMYGTAYGNGIFNLIGTDNLILDGRAGGMDTIPVWTVSNSGNSSAIMLFNDATHNEIKYLNIISNTNNVAGGSLELGSAKAIGNVFNIIRNCTFAPGTTAPINYIYSNNTTSSTYNSDNSFINNYFSAGRGILITGLWNGNNWTIDNNHFYGSSNVKILIDFEAGKYSVGNSISGNYIGGQAPWCQGKAFTNSYLNLIYAVCGGSASQLNKIDNNVIQNISITSSGTDNFNAIDVETGYFSVSNNIIGDPKASNSIYISKSALTNMIYSNAYSTISNNEISNVFSGATATTTNPYSLCGINTYDKLNSASNNSIHNLTFSTDNSATTYNLFGIYNMSDYISSNDPYSFIAKNNTIYNLSNSILYSASGSISITAGIETINSDSYNYHSLIENNMIYNLFSNNTNSVSSVVGIDLRSSYSVLNNNMIFLGMLSNNTFVTNSIYIAGIQLSDYYSEAILNFNTVMITGNAVNSGANNTYAVCSQFTSNAFVAYNNIFINTRTNIGAKHYCLSLFTESSNKLDFNLYYTPVSSSSNIINYNGTDYSSLNNWFTSGFDPHSISAPVSFKNTLTANPPDLHLLDNNAPVVSKGLYIGDVILDFDGDKRNSPNPTIGADEPPATTTFNISGLVTYDNTAATPMSNTTVYLCTPEGSKLDSASTDASGAYTFINKTPGTYKLTAKTTIVWTGSNPGDALSINRYYIGLYTFSDNLTQLASDVNADSSIDPGDALMVNRRYIGVLDSFILPDWLFDNPTITVTNTNLIQNIKALCSGDTNASYPNK